MIHSRLTYPFCSVWRVLLCLCLAVFMLSCGDEGELAEEEPGGVTDIVQPVTPPPPSVPPPVPVPPVQPAVEPGVEEPDVVEPVVEEPKVSFQDDISPILEARCAIPGCHVAGGAAGLDLSQYDTFKKGGNNGPAFVADDGDGSLVVKRIDGGGMPPIPPALNDEEIQLFIDWINEGAEDN